MRLYPHQEQVIHNLRIGFHNGHMRQVLAMATGAGKTVVASHLARAAVDKGNKVLFIVHLNELVRQAVAHFNAMDLQVGILRGEDTNYTSADDIVVASIQTIRSRSAPEWCKLAIVDEVHVLHKEHVALIERWPDTPFIGLSATPLRKGLGEHFSNLVRGPTVRWLTDNGYLVPVRAFAPNADEMEKLLRDVQAGATTHGYDYNEKQLGEVMGRKEIYGDIVSTWQDKGEDRQTLAFAVDIAHSKRIAEEFREVGVAAEHLDAYTPSEETRAVIERFRSGETRILSSVTKLGTGFDVPDASCLILARPTLSVMLDMQFKGRGLRQAEGKKDCIVLDHAGNCLRHGLPVHFEVPDLDDGKSPERGARKRKDKSLLVACTECGAAMERAQRQCPECGVDRPETTCKVVPVDTELTEFGQLEGVNSDDKESWYLGWVYDGVYIRGKDRDDAYKYAFAKFMAKFGEKPPWRWRDLPARPPSDKQRRWDKYNRIRYAKRHHR